MTVPTCAPVARSYRSTLPEAFISTSMSAADTSTGCPASISDAASRMNRENEHILVILRI